MEPFAKFFESVANGLSAKAEALLVFGLSAMAVFLIWLGVQPILGMGFSAGLYMLYVFRAERSDRHDEEMVKLDMDRIERDKVARLAQRKNRILAKKTK